MFSKTELCNVTLIQQSINQIVIFIEKSEPYNYINAHNLGIKMDQFLKKHYTHK